MMERFEPLPVIHCLPLPREGDKAAADALLACCTNSIASVYFCRSSLLSIPVFETSN